MADQRTMLITGASTGIGRETAHRALEAGYRLILAARREENLRTLEADLGGGDDVLVKTCDVGEWDQVQELVAAGTERFGAPDVVFANAGFGGQNGFMTGTVAHWRSMVLTNVLGVALTIRATLPQMLERGTGHYVITSSVVGRVVLAGSFYSATKHAVTAIGEALRLELRTMHENEQIRVTLIEPGITDTPFFKDVPAENPLQPGDLAAGVMFAISQREGVDVNEITIRPTERHTI